MKVELAINDSLWKMTDLKNPFVGKPTAQEVFTDAAFAVPEAGGFKYPAAIRGFSLLMHLGDRVARRPDDLRVHIQRIRLADSLNESDALAEAVSDLFIVLKDKGGELRSSLLKQYSRKFPEEWRNLLQTSFTSGMTESTPLPGRSRLTMGSRGRRDFIVSTENASLGQTLAQSDMDVVKEARDMIDSGQLEEACLLLETGLPNAEEAVWQEGARELAQIYQYINDGEARAQAWWRVLSKASQPRAKYWADLLNQNSVA